MAKEKEIVLGGEVKDKFKSEPTEEQVELVIDELEAQVIQGVKEVRERGMKVYWEVGEFLRAKESEFKVRISGLVARLAADNRLKNAGFSDRTLWKCLMFYGKFPVFEKVYETELGESISISKVWKLIAPPAAKKEKTVKEMAVALVNKLGISVARKLGEEIIKECDRQKED